MLRARSLDEMLPLAVAGHAAGRRTPRGRRAGPARCTTDAGLLERVVANLVANAVRHAPGSPVRVLAHVLPDDGRGDRSSTRAPACPPDQRERMFEPFQRLGDTSAGGLGLGLAVARGLTEALGGTLSAEDTPGGGLTMVLSLPRARTATDARAAAS